MVKIPDIAHIESGNTLPKLIKRLWLLRKSGKAPEEIAEETGYDLKHVRALSSFFDADDRIYERMLLKYDERFTDRQREERLVNLLSPLTAIVAMLNTNTTN